MSDQRVEAMAKALRRSYEFESQPGTDSAWRAAARMALAAADAVSGPDAAEDRPCERCQGRGYIYPPPDGGQPVFCPVCGWPAVEPSRKSKAGGCVENGCQAPQWNVSLNAAETRRRHLEETLSRIFDRAKYLTEPAWDLEGCALVGQQICRWAADALSSSVSGSPALQTETLSPKDRREAVTRSKRTDRESGS